MQRTATVSTSSQVQPCNSVCAGPFGLRPYAALFAMEAAEGSRLHFDLHAGDIPGNGEPVTVTGPVTVPAEVAAQVIQFASRFRRKDGWLDATRETRVIADAIAGKRARELCKASGVVAQGYMPPEHSRRRMR